MAGNKSVFDAVKEFIYEINFSYFKDKMKYKNDKEFGAAMTIYGISLLLGVAMIISGVYAFGSFVLMVAESIMLLVAVPICIAGICMIYSGVAKILKAESEVEEIELGGHKFIASKHIENDNLTLFNSVYEVKLTKKQYGNFVDNISLLKERVVDQAIANSKTSDTKDTRKLSESMIYNHFCKMEFDAAKKFINDLSVAASRYNDNEQTDKVIKLTAEKILEGVKQAAGKAKEVHKESTKIILPEKSAADSLQTVWTNIIEYVGSNVMGRSL